MAQPQSLCTLRLHPNYTLTAAAKFHRFCKQVFRHHSPAVERHTCALYISSKLEEASVCLFFFESHKTDRDDELQEALIIRLETYFLRLAYLTL